MAAKLGDALVPGVHYEVFEKQKTITLNEEGQRYAAISYPEPEPEPEPEPGP